MPTNAKHGKGTTLKKGINVIAELTNIGGIKITGDTIDVTTLGSPDEYKEFIGGFKDGGEVAISGFFYPGDTDGQFAMKTALDASTLDAYTITFPTSMGATWTFNGIVTDWGSPGADVGGAILFEATIKISGKPVLGLTASAGLSALVLTGTGGVLSPAFANGTYYYTFSGVSATSITITPTAASHTIQLYIDEVYSQDIVSGSASAAIPLTLNVGKKLTLVVYEAGKTQKQYEVIAVKTI